MDRLILTWEPSTAACAGKCTAVAAAASPLRRFAARRSLTPLKTRKQTKKQIKSNPQAWTPPGGNWSMIDRSPIDPTDYKPTFVMDARHLAPAIIEGSAYDLRPFSTLVPVVNIVRFFR